MKARYELIFYILLTSYSLQVNASCLNSRQVYSVKCNNKTNSSIVEPTFIAYRFAVQGSTERRCRFEPTCSRFLIESIKHHGFSKGVLYGFSRAQLQHDDNFGYLRTFYGTGKYLVFIDPVTNW